MGHRGGGKKKTTGFCRGFDVPNDIDISSQGKHNLLFEYFVRPSSFLLKKFDFDASAERSLSKILFWS